MIRYALPLLLLAGCGQDETISAFLDTEATWTLTELDGALFAASATIRFPAEGKITGRAPCNSFTASQSAPYPWIEIGPIAATRAACPDLSAEQAFLAALGSMQIAEVSGDTLLLSNDEGREMLFRSAP